MDSAPSTVRRLPIVAVIGSGDAGHGNPDLAEAVGRLVAGSGFHLLTGGGRGVLQVPHQAVRREGDGWDLEPVRAWLAARLPI